MNELKETTKNRIIKQLESKPFKKSREDILYTRLGYDLNSLSHDFCITWLDLKEVERQERRDKLLRERAKKDSRSMLSQTRFAKWSALIAAIAAIMANKTDIFSAKERGQIFI